MPTQYVKRRSSNFPATGKPHASPIYVDSDDNILKIVPASSGTTDVQVIDASSTQTLTSKTLTSPVITNPAVSGVTPVTNTSGTVVLAAATHANRLTILSKAAGGTVALPAATGTGDTYRLISGVTITSVSWAISANGTDTFSGGVLVNDSGDSSPALPEFFPAVLASSNTATLAFTAGAAKIGDWIQFQDIASGLWAVSGVFQAEPDPVTPFSHT